MTQTQHKNTNAQIQPQQIQRSSCRRSQSSNVTYKCRIQPQQRVQSNSMAMYLLSQPAVATSMVHYYCSDSKLLVLLHFCGGITFTTCEHLAVSYRQLECIRHNLSVSNHSYFSILLLLLMMIIMVRFSIVVVICVLAFYLDSLPFFCPTSTGCTSRFHNLYSFVVTFSEYHGVCSLYITYTHLSPVNNLVIHFYC